MNKKKPLSLLILLVSIVLVFFGVNIDLSSLDLFDSSYNLEAPNNYDTVDSTIDTKKEPAIDSSQSIPSNLPDYYTEYDFRNDELLESHYEKHKDEFKNNITMDEYYKKANDLVNQVSSSVITKTEEDGDSLFFDTVTGEFGVLSTDGYIRTYFIPEDGIDYYNRK